TDKQQDMLQIVTDSGEALERVISDILDLSKIEAEKLEIERTAFNLGDLARSAASLYALKAEEKGVAMSVAVDPCAEGAFIGDPTRIRQVLQNLVSNAVKFTSKGRVDVRVDREASEDGGSIARVSVADTGIGVDEEAQSRMFDAFSQAEGSTTRRFGGTGLGLTICKRLCGLMGGSLSVKSVLGEGSTFAFTVPLGAVVEETGAAASAGDAPGLPAGGAPLRILCAEDNRTNQMVLQAFLEPCNDEVTIVSNGREAVETYEQGEFDLVLMDIHMPERDGLAATDDIRRIDRARGRRPVTIIALTADAMSHQVKEYLNRGMDGHLAKPLDPRLLHAKLNEARQRVSGAGAPSAA
ncbi:MAG: ATP-binding protein, partial [Caulobacterales bacterium]|nr:ATP-binding protein [Caulobacterales bacterium]